MCREKLLKTLKKYEVLPPDIDANTNMNDSNSDTVLINDINRIDFEFSSISSDKGKVKLYKNILYEVLKKFPLKYIQGMGEVATVIVDVYFQPKINGVVLENEDKKDTKNEANSFLELSKEDKKAMKLFFEENKDLMARMKNSLISILKTKFLIFFKDNFALYRECNEIFIACMKKKGVKINRDVSFKFMNHILTFFKRVYSNEKVAYSIYDIILNSDPCVLFTLLVIFYENVQSGGSTSNEFSNRIQKIDDDLVKKVVAEHAAFLKTKDELSRRGSSGSYFFFGAAASAIAIGLAIAYKLNKKE